MLSLSEEAIQIQRTASMFFQKKFQELKSFFFGGYKKLPRSLSFRPFSCSGRNKRRRDNFYTDFYDEWEADLNCSTVKKQNDGVESMLAKSAAAASKDDDRPLKKIPAIKHEGKVKEKNRGGNGNGNGNGNPFGKREDFCSKKMKNQDLVKKMKEFEMLDSADDVEQVLDIEEALHYYSRLTSPVYLDIVNNFFTDMHSEYSIPKATVTLNPTGHSKPRFGSIRL